MTDELKPCLAYPCGGVLETNLYDASLTCSRCQFQVADELEYNALVAGRQAAIDDEKQNPWKAAIIQELIVDCIFAKEHETDPHKALAEAIDWNRKIALDPSVSAEARALQQEAIDAALSDLIYDLGGLYIHRSGHELYNGAIDDVARLIKDQLGTNPLAERAAEYARGIEFRVGQLAERDARIAVLEHQLHIRTFERDGLIKEKVERSARIAELERELTEARTLLAKVGEV